MVKEMDGAVHADEMPPAEIVESAEAVGRWLASRNVSVWELGTCASREALSVLRDRMARYELQAERNAIQKDRDRALVKRFMNAYRIEIRRLQRDLDRLSSYYRSLEAALSEITTIRPSGAAPKLRRAIEIAQGALREVQK